ncbi:MAG TPA: ATP-binding protein [Bacteroidales bacterium]|nr:ATP-binding protein [Bacteroidales bacterium]
MKRQAMQYLEKWKINEHRKPLIISGARQVGKTWLMKEFGKRNYKNVAYVNFEKSKSLKSLFETDYDINRIIGAVRIETGFQVDPDNTLVIFDEIQEAPGGLTSLKYFYENAPDYQIVAAGSLLGVAMNGSSSFPVGKVEFLDLYPMNFSEFLMAMGQESLLELVNKQDWGLIKSFKDKFIGLLKQYYYCGGMPEAVSVFVESGDYNEIRQIQSRILSAYEQDFSKHAPPEIVPRIRMLWHAIPSQLAKENKKFIYSAVKKGSRAKDFELALAWLIDCGLVYKISRITKPGIPLIAYEDFSSFKLFTVDVGLLAAMGNIDPKTLLEGNIIFEEFKGALTEQYVLQQLVTIPEIVVHYWSSANSTGEIDFVIQNKGDIYPLEVKAEENLQAKSLKAFHQKYPKTKPIRTSMSNYRQEEQLINLPMYAIQTLPEIYR